MLLWFIGRIGRGQIKRSQTTDWSENAKSSVELAENRDLQFRSRNAHLGTGLQDVPREDLGDFPQQCNRVRTFWYPVAIMAKADSIRGRCVDEFMKGLLMLFESGNHPDVKSSHY